MFRNLSACCLDANGEDHGRTTSLAVEGREDHYIIKAQMIYVEYQLTLSADSAMGTRSVVLEEGKRWDILIYARR